MVAGEMDIQRVLDTTVPDERAAIIAEQDRRIARLRKALEGFVREHGPLSDTIKYLRKALEGCWYDGEKLRAAQDFYAALLEVREHGDLEVPDGAQD